MCVVNKVSGALSACGYNVLCGESTNVSLSPQMYDSDSESLYEKLVRDTCGNTVKGY